MSCFDLTSRAMAFAACFFAFTLCADPIDDYLRGEMKSRDIPGLAVAVQREGQLVKLATYGMANLELSVPATTNSVFEIGSVTKQITGAAVLLLVEDGKVKLNDPVSAYLDGAPAAWTNVTVRHLLTHTSGIRNYTGLNGFEARRNLNAKSFIEEIGRYPLESEPGEKYSYCNSAYNLLGYIVEKVSGQTYWEFIEARIFKPLGMTSAGRRDLRPIIPHRADGYEKSNGRRINRDSDLTDIFSAGAIVANIVDMATWDAALDSNRLLNASSREAMWTPVTLNSGKTYPYGFGWRLDDYKNARNIGHSGSTSGFSASLQRFPDDKLSVIVLTNTGEQIATTLARGVAGFYIAKLAPVIETGGEQKP